jgi:hypothetical protein
MAKINDFVGNYPEIEEYETESIITLINISIHIQKMEKISEQAILILKH